MAALLSSEMGNTDKLVQHIAKVREMDIAVLPPNVNLSESAFAVRDGKILYALGAIKGMGDTAIETILEGRFERPFSSLHDFCAQVNLQKCNKRLLELLVKCGAMDCFEAPRAALMAGLDTALCYAQARQKEKKSGQYSLLAMMGGGKGAGGSTAPASACSEPQGGKLPDVPEWPEKEKLRLEREALGLYLSGHPLNRYRKLIGRLATCTTATLAEKADRKYHKDVTLAVLVAGLRERPLKNGGGRMAILTLEDLEGTCEAVVFSKEFEAFEDLLKTDQPLLIAGTVSLDGDDESPVAKLRVKEASLLSDARKKKTGCVRFRLDAEALTADKLESLKGILDRFQGSTRTYLHIQLPDRGPETILRLPTKIGACEELEQEVDFLFKGKVTEFG